MSSFSDASCTLSSCDMSKSLTVSILPDSRNPYSDFVDAPGIRNRTWLEQPTSYIRVAGCNSYIAFGMGCINPALLFNSLYCQLSSPTVVTIHMSSTSASDTSSTGETSSWTLLQMAFFPSAQRSYVIPSSTGRFLLVYWSEDGYPGAARLFERLISDDLSSPFDFSHPVAVLQGDGTCNSAPGLSSQSLFACPNDSCLLWPTASAYMPTQLGWFQRSSDPANRTWSLVATLDIPINVTGLPPDKAPYSIISVDVSYGAASSDDALVAAVAASRFDYTFTAIVLWSSGLPGKADAANNTWTKWNATVLPEPYPEFYAASIGWIGTSAGSLHNCAVQWTNASASTTDGRGYEDAIWIYQVAANESSSTYGTPQVMQRSRILPLLNASTGVPFPRQSPTVVSTSSTGSRFIVWQVASEIFRHDDPNEHTPSQSRSGLNIKLLASRFDLWEDLDVYTPLNTSTPPAWLVPTAVGVSVGVIALAMGVLHMVRRYRGGSFGMQNGHEQKSTVSTPLLDHT